MLDREVASRYASVLFELATECDKRELFYEQLSLFAGLIEKQELLRKFFENPILSYDVKYGALSGLDVHFESELLAFLKLLIKKDRFTYLNLICEKYLNLLRAATGVVKVSITTAMPLSDAQKKRMLAALSTRFNAGIEPEYLVDPAVLGGVSISSDGRIIDYTLSARLENMKRKLAESVVASGSNTAL